MIERRSMSAPGENQSSRQNAILEFSSMLGGVHTIRDLAEAIYNALCPLVAFDWVNIGLILNPSRKSPLQIVSNQFEQSQAYWEYYSRELTAYDFFAQYVMSKPAGFAALKNEAFDPTNERHVWFDRTMRETWGVGDALAVVVIREEDLFAGFSVFRKADSPLFTEADLHVFAAIVPIMQTTIRLCLKQKEDELVVANAVQLLDSDESVYILFDSRLRLIHLPQAARELLDRFFPEEKSRRLPEFIQQWLESAVAPTQSLRFGEGPWVLATKGKDGRLVLTAGITPGPQGEATLLLGLKQEARSKPFAALKKYNLSDREIETLEYLPLGYTNRQIASAMGLKEITIKKHLQSIGEKLGANGRTEILYQAMRLVRESD
ncbi:MAG: DNA-binding response regulator [Myxococcales bacterium]|nr:MAG: DNA-binding response regulator [Myxococcales bacterium]